MKREAEAHAAEDKKRREAIELKNQGENLAYQTEKTLKEYGEKVSADVRGNIESALNNLRDALKSDDADRIKKTMENLNQVSHKLAEEMYKASRRRRGGAGRRGRRGPKPQHRSRRRPAAAEEGRGRDRRGVRSEGVNLHLIAATQRVAGEP